MFIVRLISEYLIYTEEWIQSMLKKLEITMVWQFSTII